MTLQSTKFLHCSCYHHQESDPPKSTKMTCVCSHVHLATQSLSNGGARNICCATRLAGPAQLSRTHVRALAAVIFLARSFTTLAPVWQQEQVYKKREETKKKKVQRCVTRKMEIVQRYMTVGINTRAKAHSKINSLENHKSPIHKMACMWSLVPPCLF